MIRFTICDDEQTMFEEIDSLLMLLCLLYKQESEVFTFYSGEEFCAYFNKKDEVLDVVLMDIEMHGITGIEAGLRLRQSIASDQTVLIFISSHKDYYRELIDLNVFRFIPKPVNKDEFNLKLDDAI
jgi:two-component SAPR family response regulator